MTKKYNRKNYYKLYYKYLSDQHYNFSKLNVQNNVDSNISKNHQKGYKELKQNPNKYFNEWKQKRKKIHKSFSWEKNNEKSYNTRYSWKQDKNTYNNIDSWKHDKWKEDKWEEDKWKDNRWKEDKRKHDKWKEDKWKEDNKLFDYTTPLLKKNRTHLPNIIESEKFPPIKFNILSKNNDKNKKPPKNKHLLIHDITDHSSPPPLPPRRPPSRPPSPLFPPPPIDFFNLLDPFKDILDNINSNKTIQDIIKDNDTILKDIEKENLPILEFEILDESIHNIQDLINVGLLYDTKYKDINKRFSLDIKTLHNLVKPLQELQDMIGLTNVKTQIFEQIIFYLQHLDNKNKDMLHTVIQGDPGMGKTQLAKILGKIYTNMGILSKGTFKSVKRADLIGGYLGQTAMKTQKVLNNAKGGVLFIDEAYSLGNNEGKDSFSKECIDTLTAFLSDYQEDIIVIIAGYKKDLQKCFFSYNNGLERRFNWRYELKEYSSNELRSIFLKKIKDHDWSIESEDEIPESFFKKNIKSFPYYGGDMETLFHKCKLAHSMRVLKCSENKKKKITKHDLNKGYELFLKSKGDTINKDNNEYDNSSMYL